MLFFSSYLKNRTQYVTINTKDSNMVATNSGVPQGSLLGLVIYNFYINELPNIVVDKDCKKNYHENNEKLVGPNCDKCGQILCYADDASFCITSKSKEYNQNKVLETLDKAAYFLNNNDQTINETKTTLCKVMIKQKINRI